MSLVERVFPASELAALKHAVLAMDDLPTAKRRKIDRQESIHSRQSNDSGYHSDHSTSSKTSGNAHSPASSSHSDEDDFTTKIAEARARLYSNASISISSPPREAESEADSPEESVSPADYHSPVSVETLADSPARTSGCSLDTFLRLGLAVTTHERSLLTAISPLKPTPIYRTAESQARALQLLQRRRAALLLRRKQLEQERRPSYQGFAISSHEVDEEDECEEQEEQECQQSHPETSADIPRAATLDSALRQSPFEDFFNIEAACENAVDGAEVDGHPRSI
ncbi:uncharacterized protein AB675_6512 [Cyphellophora attinorum]|uniref:Uncharacterized protein n=1 Tax=Cyphellophora attinorum TaxID=1664694 RepID=A0A0N1HFJ8_9EURO|nr:uncharacterized protein AB675_6512 [Phialophora attinorum]KPI44017.1 hypothetical protein AB675_6512 [Phialophora attinorum]